MKVFDPTTDAWLGLLRKGIFAAAAKARKLAQRNPTFSNLIPLVPWGMRLLKESGLLAIPTDKDGGYALVEQTAMEGICNVILESDIYIYEEVPLHTVDRQRQASTARKLAFSIAEFEGEECLKGALCRPMIPKTSSTVAKLKLTCKTHKPKGSVKFRPIHASSEYMLAGLGAWLAKQCRTQMSNANFIIPDTKKFKDDIMKIRPKPTHKFVKLDIAQFFLSGTLHDLVRDTTMGMTGPAKILAKRVLEFLLWEQYVSCRWLPGRVFRTVRGTGMGLVHSGEVADCAYFHRVERGRMDDKSYLARYKIDGYWRFKDDALLLVNDMDLAKQFIWDTMRLADYFVVECEAVSSTQVKFLEVMVEKTYERFVIRPEYKPTNLGIPLDTSSAHPVHVHTSWPKAVLRRAMLLSSTLHGAEAAREVLRQRFIQHFAPKPIIDIFEKCTQRT